MQSNFSVNYSLIPLCTGKRMVSAGVKKLMWEENELLERRNGDPENIRLARELRVKTTLSLTWIAAGLKTGSWT